MLYEQPLAVDHQRARALLRAALLHATGNDRQLLHCMRARNPYVAALCEALGVESVEELLAIEANENARNRLTLITETTA